MIEEDVFDMAYTLELKYDCLIDIIVLADKTLNEIRDCYVPHENTCTIRLTHGSTA